MGMYDTMVGELDGHDVELQVKLFDRCLDVFEPGDRVPVSSFVLAPFSIVSPGGDMWANVDADGVFVGLSRVPMFDQQVSKWGGPPDQTNPVAAVLRALGAVS